jgi:hypothetical protein
MLIHWYYEKDDFEMLESGEDYASILKIPFKMVPVDVEGIKNPLPKRREKARSISMKFSGSSQITLEQFAS